MHTFTNTTNGPKGVNTRSGLTVFVEPGETSGDLEVTEGELASAEATGWFKIDASKKVQEKAAEDAKAEAETPEPKPAADTKK